MKQSSPLKIAVLLAGFAACGIAHGQDKAKPGAPPKITVDEFRSKLKKDESNLPAGGQMMMSYAPVVEKILPSVVTIESYGMGREVARNPFEDMDQIPPNFREFFRRFGLPDGMEEDDEGNQEDAPRRRGPRQAPTPRERERDRVPSGMGSGIIITADGYILTNNHVVEGASKLEVTVDNPTTAKKTHEAKVVGTDPMSDVALIKIEATGLPHATLTDSERLRVGDIVLAAGAPLGLEHSVSQGIVSALGRKNLGIVGQQRRPSYENFIQTDAAINRGNSGGPLVDALGRVVGINTAIFAGMNGMNGGIGFAIPLSQALAIVEDLLDDGQVQRGMLGIVPDDVDLENARILGLPDQAGAFVRSMTKGSPAEKAGLEVGDVIVSAAGRKVLSGADLRLLISSQKPGTAVPLEVLRGKEKITLTATLAAVNEQTLQGIFSGGSGSPAAPAAEKKEILKGVNAENITPDLAEKYEIGKDVTGVVVTKVNPDSGAADVGIQEGDVIQAINQKPVKNLGEARALVKSGENQANIVKLVRKGVTELVVVRDE